MDRARFDRFDVDKTGELEESEVQAMMQEMGFECDAAYLNAMMRKFDTDGNGSVGFAEFQKMWKFITPVSTPRTAVKKGATPCGFLGSIRHLLVSVWPFVFWMSNS